VGWFPIRPNSPLSAPAHLLLLLCIFCWDTSMRGPLVGITLQPVHLCLFHWRMGPNRQGCLLPLLRDERNSRTNAVDPARGPSPSRAQRLQKSTWLPRSISTSSPTSRQARRSLRTQSWTDGRGNRGGSANDSVTWTVTTLSGRDLRWTTHKT
jgi:hypothetical protein